MDPARGFATALAVELPRSSRGAQARKGLGGNALGRSYLPYKIEKVRSVMRAMIMHMCTCVIACM